MSLLMVLLPVFAAGFILGCVYFPLLWLTIRHLSQSERPLRLMMVSFISRFAVAVSRLLPGHEWPDGEDPGRSIGVCRRSRDLQTFLQRRTETKTGLDLKSGTLKKRRALWKS